MSDPDLFAENQQLKAKINGMMQETGQCTREKAVLQQENGQLRATIENQADQIRLAEARMRAFERDVMDMTERVLREHPEGYEHACLCDECKANSL